MSASSVRPFENPSLPFLGAGIEWAGKIENQILSHLEQISCFEFIPENFFEGKRPATLKKVKESGIPTLVHAVELSLGSDEPIKESHFQAVLDLARQVNCINVSDHIAMTECDGIEIGQLTPLVLTSESVDAVARKVDRLQERVFKELGVPFLIENVANRFVLPEPEMSEPAFINSLLEKTGCGFLLDLNNLYTNVTNLGGDPYAWLDEVNLRAIHAIHLAGGDRDRDGDLVDSHSEAVPPTVWEYYEYVCQRVRPPMTIVERTGNFPDYSVLLAELAKADAIVEATSGSRAKAMANRMGLPTLSLSEIQSREGIA